MSEFIGILLMTFVLEDVAMAGSLTLVASGQISVESAILANFLGISIGDVFLYWLGRLGLAKFKNNKMWLLEKMRKLTENIPNFKTLTISIVLSRFLPGFRFPTHLAAGMSGYSFFLFLTITSLSIFAWLLVVINLATYQLSIIKLHPILTGIVFFIFIKVISVLIKFVQKKFYDKKVV